MKIETIMKITVDFQYIMARNSKEAVCVLISSAVRNGNIEDLSELIDSKEITKKAIETYQHKSHKHDEDIVC